MKKVAVIGAGLAGSECAWALAETYRIPVDLYEMKSIKPTEAQISQWFAELVCSNSLKSLSLLNPAGVLKEEMKLLGSLVLEAGFLNSVPAGEALAVDRELFSQYITEKLKSHPNIQIFPAIVSSLEELLKQDYAAVVIATGPLTESALAEDIRNFIGQKELYFYDAIAPIVDGDSLDQTKMFFANRVTRTRIFEEKKRVKKSEETEKLEKEERLEQLELCDHAEQVEEKINEEKIEEKSDGDYLNIPLTKEEYFSFVEKVKEGAKVPHHEFEEPKYFNGCQPIEVLAESGPRTLSFGPMKAKGLTNPKTGRYPYAVIQLRKESQHTPALNMVGFQTRLTWGAQKEIFKSLPGFENAEFFRMGSMHRNTYIISPSVLQEDLSLRKENRVYFAGQIMGVEGYLESSAMGLLIGHMIGKKLTKGLTLPLPPADTSLGALSRYTVNVPQTSYTPMNIHWGLFSHIVSDIKLEKSKRREIMSDRAKVLFDSWYKEFFL